MPEKAPEKNLQYKKISKKSIILLEIICFVVWALLFGVVLWVFTPFTWLWYALVWLLGVLLILVEGLYLPVLYNSYQYCVTDRIVSYRHGVFFNQRQFVYRDRIIYVSVYNTPLTYIMGISTVVISTAGAKLRIGFLNRRIAKELAQELSPSPKDSY